MVGIRLRGGCSASVTFRPRFGYDLAGWISISWPVRGSSSTGMTTIRGKRNQANANPSTNATR